jgi:Flp pilus assembly pilin Flp
MMLIIRRFAAEERGFVAAEKALITLLALGIIIVVAKFILAGSTKAVTTSKTNLEGQTLPANPQYADPGGGGAK